ncbi:MAG: Transcriptional regulator, AcrR family [Ktedonobacterales bacterium]|jgi:AcrR family transcriptional regulator|nr:MAG: Transcriptional regulator, AcrR family [Ktedonobacterales bacterium]
MAADSGSAGDYGTSDMQRNADESIADFASHLRALEETLSPAQEAPPRIPRQARSREKRDEILKAAARLFVRDGYAQTTSDTIAAEAGVSVGTFYNYFRNKRQALLTLVIERLDGIFSNIRLAQMDFSDGHPREVIRRAIGAMLERGNSGLRRAWLEVMAQEPELQPYQQMLRQYVLVRIEDALRKAEARGETWPELDISATALAIFTLLDTISLRTDTGIDDERLADALTDMVYRSTFPQG